MHVVIQLVHLIATLDMFFILKKNFINEKGYLTSMDMTSAAGFFCRHLRVNGLTADPPGSEKNATCERPLLVYVH